MRDWSCRALAFPKCPETLYCASYTITLLADGYDGEITPHDIVGGYNYHYRFGIL